jgi:Tfp pilus assembly protein PilO
MSDAGTQVSHPRPGTEFSPAAIARLRAMAVPRPSPRELVKSASRAELAAVAGLLILIVAIALLYFKSIAPGQITRMQITAERDENARKLDELREVAANPAGIRTQLETVKQTLDQFRAEHLRPRVAGRLAIVGTIEQLTKKTGVRLSSDVDFETNLATGSEGATRGGHKVAGSSGGESGNRSVTSYPSLGVSYSISGTYPQLRQFISGFEQSPQFVVFDSISLSTSDESDPEAGRMRPRGGVNDVITLEVEMTAYFQPESGAGFGVAFPEAPAGAPAPAVAPRP